jgi:hypothetical protein
MAAAGFLQPNLSVDHSNRNIQSANFDKATLDILFEKLKR